MPIPVSDRGANKEELIVHAAEILSGSKQRTSIFNAIYRGKQRVKTVIDLMRSTGLPRKAVLGAGKRLASNDIVQQTKIGGITAYEKIDFFQGYRDVILRLARDTAKRLAVPTRRRPSAPSGIVRVKFNLRLPSKQINATRVSVDDIRSFECIKNVPRSTRFYKVPEKRFKHGIARILKEKGHLKDWGGELNDLFSTNLNVSGKRLVAAFAFKGPGMTGRLTPGKMGKNGDQIQRLLRCPADIFVIQYWRDIDESVLEQLEKLTQVKSFLEAKQLWYCLIDGYDSVRLIRAYRTAFPGVSLS